MRAMGQRAEGYFVQAHKLGGVIAKMRLAAMSRITSAEARAVPDDPELIARLDLALERLREDMAGMPPLPAMDSNLTKPEQQLELVRRHVAVFLELMSQRRLLSGDLAEITRRITSTAAHTLDCARVSVWVLDPRWTSIECVDLYVREGLSHSTGLVLQASDFPAYFEALKGERTIAAHDAHTDPRTSCFSESYLAPLGIGAMLDVPIWVGGETVGLICHEHIGGPRTWTADEESFAYLMAHFIGIGMTGSRTLKSVPR